MGVYPVDYPATTDFPTALIGITDASAHIEATAAKCPNTKMVLGGFSQGAAVMGFVTSNVIPDGAPEGAPNPMPPDVASHVAAVALFGKPNDRFMRAINQPDVEVGPLYAAKTIDLCVPDDFVCSSGRDFNAHMQYAETGMVDQAATFTANLLPAPAPAAPPPSPAPAARPQPPAAAPVPATPPQAPAPTPHTTAIATSRPAGDRCTSPASPWNGVELFHDLPHHRTRLTGAFATKRPPARERAEPSAMMLTGDRRGHHQTDELADAARHSIGERYE